MTREQVFSRMEQRGYKRILVYFSGGNDQGGIDRILAECTGDTEKELAVFHGEYIYDKAKNDWVLKHPLDEDEQLANAVGEPVFAKYYTFAGEFYVDGQVIWDLSDKSVKLHGQETVDHYDSIEEVI